jgi:hypothetical protein
LKIVELMRRLSPRQRVQSAVEVAGLIGVILVTLSSAFSGNVTEAVLLFAVGLVLTTQLEARLETALRENLIEHVPPTDRQKAFDELTRAPTEWMFRGGSGRWFRSVAVPAVSKSATTYAPVRVVLLDPRNENTCAAYARYRKRSGWYADHTVTPRGIQAEVLATIFTLMVAHSETRVRAQVGLINSYSPSRVDANGQYMIVTTPDLSHPPLRVKRGHWFYDVVADEVIETLENGPVIAWPPLTDTEKKPVAERVKEHLARARVVLQATGCEEPLLSGYAADNVDWNLVVKGLSPVTLSGSLEGTSREVDRAT